MLALIIATLTSLSPQASASDEGAQMGQALCISGFAESSVPWSSSLFIPRCQKVESQAEGKCIEGFASSPRRWNSDDFFRVCKRVENMAQATCVYGFARSSRSWDGNKFLKNCLELF